jgi:hypothetical protein
VPCAGGFVEQLITEYARELILECESSPGLSCKLSAVSEESNLTLPPPRGFRFVVEVEEFVGGGMETVMVATGVLKIVVVSDEVGMVPVVRVSEEDIGEATIAEKRKTRKEKQPFQEKNNSKRKRKKPNKTQNRQQNIILSEMAT